MDCIYLHVPCFTGQEKLELLHLPLVFLEDGTEIEGDECLKAFQSSILILVQPGEYVEPPAIAPSMNTEVPSQTPDTVQPEVQSNPSLDTPIESDTIKDMPSPVAGIQHYTQQSNDLCTLLYFMC